MGWIGPLLNAVLAGDLSQLSRMFAIDGTVTSTAWSLTLVPHSAALKHALARIDIAGNTTVDRIQLREGNGDDVTIVFSNIQYPKSLPADVAREFEQTH
mgnify:FL=1